MATNAQDLVELTSGLDFAATLERLRGVIAEAGLQVFAEIDHAAGAAAVGLEMAPATVLLYGHARGGTPIMQAFPQAGLDLPLRVLARQDADGRVVVAFHPIAQALAWAGVPAEMAGRLGPAQQKIVDAFGA